MSEKHEDDPWTVVSEKRVYENPWIAVDHREVLNPVGQPGVYGIVRFHKLAVGVVPIDEAGRVHLVGQWRVPLDEFSWEIPEGGAEPGEPPEETARRELKEETGLAVGRLTPILSMSLSNGSTDERAIVFLATNLTSGIADPEGTEALSHRVVPFAQALHLAVTGALTDSMTVAGLLRAHHMAVCGEIEPALAALMLESK
jgi:8-oxo-dGTP pyrophosphatase MutT (NUDIX family)